MLTAAYGTLLPFSRYAKFVRCWGYFCRSLVASGPGNRDPFRSWACARGLRCSISCVRYRWTTTPHEDLSNVCEPVRSDSFSSVMKMAQVTALNALKWRKKRESPRAAEGTTPGGRMSKARRATARRLLLGALGVAIAFGQGLGAPTRAETALLRTVENDVARRWPNVIHMPPGQLAELMKEGRIALFDVREQQEYQVSHIRGALRINPAIAREEFLERHASAILGKMVVFYCAVGQRSSRLVDRVADGLKARGAIEVYNLKGGIFAWHNDAYALVDGAGPTDFVHPYSQAWGGVLRRQNLLRTTPRQ
jgi:rhodanese-related sulfurtransferase